MRLDAAPCVTLVAGRSGSGKTTFALRYLLNVAASCRFVFDDRGQVAARLRLNPCRTARDCEEALQTRWVVLNPHAMFPGRLADGFRWFCQWAFEASTRGDGKKVFFADELWQWSTARQIPQELSNIVQTGRVHELELFSCTLRPRQFHADIRAQVTEWVLFNLNQREEIEAVADFIPADVCQELPALPMFHFLAVNAASGGILRGKMRP